MASDSRADAEQLFVPRRSAVKKFGSCSVKESDKAISVYSSLSSRSSLKSCSIRDFMNRDTCEKGAADSPITVSSDSGVSDSTVSSDSSGSSDSYINDHNQYRHYGQSESSFTREEYQERANAPHLTYLRGNSQTGRHGQCHLTVKNNQHQGHR
eukprot:TCONS_00050139-protein